MPELPFITVLAENLGPHLRGRTIREVFVPSPSVLKTVAPPITDLAGRQITDIRRRGKLLLFDLTGGLVMVMHLRRNGRLQVAPGRAGRTGRDTALVLALDNGTDLRMIELGPKKAASVWLFPAGEAESVPPVGGLGLEPLGTEFALPALARMLREERTTLKRFLTTQRYIVGIGNAYADEILWEARLSPQVMTPQLADGEIEGLHGAVVTTLERAVEAHRREFAGALPMKEPLDLLSVHRHGGAPCPRCGTPIAVIYYEDRETYYCPRCQTGGKVYADRRRSRLLK